MLFRLNWHFVQKSTRATPAYLVYGCPFIFNTYGGYSLLGGKRGCYPAWAFPSDAIELGNTTS